MLDEADRMLDTEFLEQVQEIIAGCTREGVQKAVFSATLPSSAEKIAMDMMSDPIRVVVGLKYVLLFLIKQQGPLKLIHFNFLPTKGYAVATHRTIPKLCCRRFLETSNPPSVPSTALQSASAYLCIFPRTCFLIG